MTSGEAGRLVAGDGLPIEFEFLAFSWELLNGFRVLKRLVVDDVEVLLPAVFVRPDAVLFLRPRLRIEPRKLFLFGASEGSTDHAEPGVGGDMVVFVCVEEYVTYLRLC